MPLYCELAVGVELTTTPYHHPILPILLEPARAVVDREHVVPTDLTFGDRERAVRLAPV